MGRPKTCAKKYSPFLKYIQPVTQTTTTTLEPTINPNDLIFLPESGKLCPNITTTSTTTTSTTPENFENQCTEYIINGRRSVVQYVPCGEDNTVVRIFDNEDFSYFNFGESQNSILVGSGNIPQFLCDCTGLGSVSYQGAA